MKTSLSAQAVEFIDQCLNKDMDQRPSAEELLQHPWVKGKAEAPYVDRKSAA